MASIIREPESITAGYFDEPTNNTNHAGTKRQYEKPQLQDLNRYRHLDRHRCKLSDIPVSRPITGQDACSPGSPALLPIDKLKLHYVVHYMLRGTWSSIVPEEKDESRIEFYQCNICQRRFKNNLNKKEFPARGSVICHLATDHGYLIDAMRHDDRVDMQSEIDLLSEGNRQLLTYKDCKSNTLLDTADNKHGIVTAKESTLWKYKRKQGDAVSRAEVPVSEGESKIEATDGKDNIKSDSEEKEPQKAGTNTTTGIQPGVFYSKETRARPLIIECPHCQELKGNTDPASLRLHIFHHYKDQWAKKIDGLEQGSDNRYICDICPKRKSVTGATPEGARLAAICHFAIQHGELRQVLQRDMSLKKDFILDLYWDVDNPNEKNRNCSYYLSQTAIVKTLKPTSTKSGEGRNRKVHSTIRNKTYKNRPPKARRDNKRRRRYSSEDTEEEDAFTSDISTDDECDNDKESKDTLFQEASKSECYSYSAKRNDRGKIIGKMRENFRQNQDEDGGSRGASGMSNPNYIRKRKKLKLSLEDLENDDSSSDGEWKGRNFKSTKGHKLSYKRHNLKESSCELMENAIKTRFLPRRAVTLKTKSIIDTKQDDSEDENDNIE